MSKAKGLTPNQAAFLKYLATGFKVIGAYDTHDDIWNMRNGMIPYVEGEEHFDG